MKKIISLIYPIYDFKAHEIKNILFLAEKLSFIYIDLIVLSDNPSINSLLNQSFNRIDNITFVPSEVNVGKYQLIKNYMSSVNSHWVKIVDPDDIILVNELHNFVEFIISNGIHKGSYIPFIVLGPTNNVLPDEHLSIDINYSKRSIIRERIFSKKTMVNENSVIPTNSIRSFSLVAYNQTKSSDVLLSLSYFINHDIFDYVQYGPTFYVYNYRKGLTGTNEFNENMFNQFLNFLKIMKDFKNKNNMTAPSKFDYLWAHNSMVMSNYSKSKKLKIMNDVIKLLNDSGTDKWSQEIREDSKEILEYRRMILNNEKIEL